MAQLGFLVLIFYVSCALFVLLVLGSVMRLVGFSIVKFLKYIREELLIVLGTASSDAVLPQLMRKLKGLGVGKSTVGLVIPTGYSFNLDGFSIYLTLAAVFIAQATNTPLAFGDLLIILGVSMVTSKGAHGVPGSAIVILAATLAAVPALPIVGLVLVLAVDWFMGMGRALTNMIGNAVATVVIGAWENDIDRARVRQVLDGEIKVGLDEAAEIAAERGTGDRARQGVRPAPGAGQLGEVRDEGEDLREGGPRTGAGGVDRARGCWSEAKAQQTPGSATPLGTAVGEAVGAPGRRSTRSPLGA